LREYQERAALVSGLVSRYYDGHPIDEDPEPSWSPDVDLLEFDGESFHGHEAVKERLSKRADWARARFKQGGSWTIQPVGKFHVIATRSVTVNLADDDRQPRCVLVDARAHEVGRIREFEDAAAAHQALRDSGVWTHPY
jgi:hypothetical protein